MEVQIKTLKALQVGLPPAAKQNGMACFPVEARGPKPHLEFQWKKQPETCTSFIFWAGAGHRKSACGLNLLSSTPEFPAITTGLLFRSPVMVTTWPCLAYPSPLGIWRCSHTGMCRLCLLPTLYVWWTSSVFSVHRLCTLHVFSAAEKEIQPFQTWQGEHSALWATLQL